jgi:zinc-ribbon domain
MKFCIQCGAALPQSARFCGSCGTAVVPDAVESMNKPEGIEASESAEEHDNPPIAPEPQPDTILPQMPAADVSEPKPLAMNEPVKGGPNWLLIGGGAALLFLLLLYYLIFIRDDVPGNPALPAEQAKEAVKGEEGENKRLYVIADANVRDKATAQGSSIMGKLKRGSQVEGTIIIGADGTSEWLELADGQGFVGIVNLGENQPPAITKALGDKNWTSDKAIEIWSQPDPSATLLDRVPAGTVLTLFGLTANDYIEIKMKKGGVGYITDGTRIASLSATGGKPVSLSFNLSTCNFGGELEVEFEKLAERVSAAYQAAEKADYPNEEAREKAMAKIEGRSSYQKMQRSFNGLSITAISQDYQGQSIYFADPKEKVIAAFKSAGMKVGSDGTFASAELSAGIDATGSEGAGYGKSSLYCGA